MDDQHGQSPSSIARTGEVARAFLTLGLTAFGGPVAHLAHFRRELVERRRWIGEAAYAELVAYCIRSSDRPCDDCIPASARNLPA